MSEQEMSVVSGRYRHHTGRIYVVEGVYHEADLGVDFVTHRGEHDGRRWVRSVANFCGHKDGDIVLLKGVNRLAQITGYNWPSKRYVVTLDVELDLLTARDSPDYWLQLAAEAPRKSAEFAAGTGQ